MFMASPPMCPAFYLHLPRDPRRRRPLDVLICHRIAL